MEGDDTVGLRRDQRSRGLVTVSRKIISCRSNSSWSSI